MGSEIILHNISFFIQREFNPRWKIIGEILESLLKNK